VLAIGFKFFQNIPPELASILPQGRYRHTGELVDIATLQSRRCLIPADSFYEWKKLDTENKQPMRIMLKSGEPFAFAGIWEYWKEKNNPEAEGIISCSIITTVPNSLMESIHDRMPVILSPDLYRDWLDPDNQDTGSLRELLLPYDPGLMKAYPVSTLVNSVRNKGPEVIEPMGSPAI
jgi:putative SOS response-associated peptidase YedK